MKCENGIWEFDLSDKSSEWWEETPETQILIQKVGEFDTYNIFSDMTFQEGSLTEKMIKCHIIRDGKGYESIIDLPPELSMFDYTMFRFSVEPLEECEGRYDIWSQRLTVTPENINNDSIILHEMIHLHESVLMALPIYYHEAVMYCLYSELSKKIPNLNYIIETSAHIYNCEDMAQIGGLHDMLFLLKSFDIDLRFGCALGTTYGYDMKEQIKKTGNKAV
ncbi:hypothetical protein [Ruminococcus flavefaciens]|uniref:hypothetical protein n=1 Tax=Ruminococcus flavefaciens TaxID=1265 RepID=UPI0026EC55C9|nr:hypothetical protein [Ruminococcus flavefaciens]